MVCACKTPPSIFKPVHGLLASVIKTTVDVFRLKKISFYFLSQKNRDKKNTSEPSNCCKL